MSNDLPKVATTPQGVAHAADAEELRAVLADRLTGEVTKVYPTKRREGVVSLTFAQAWELLGYPDGHREYLRGHTSTLVTPTFDDGTRD